MPGGSRGLGYVYKRQAFNWCKSAMIIHGVYARYKEGKKTTVGVDMEDLRERVGRCIDLAESALK